MIICDYDDLYGIQTMLCPSTKQTRVLYSEGTKDSLEHQR